MIRSGWFRINDSIKICRLEEYVIISDEDEQRYVPINDMKYLCDVCKVLVSVEEFEGSKAFKNQKDDEKNV